MKQIIVLLLSLSYFIANAQGIEFFKGTFDEAKALAKKTDKIIFMDAYAAWCGPCKRMAANVFPKKEAGDFFNKNFINLKVDMEKGEGRAIAQKYGVRSYPTLLFLDFEGNVVHQARGARSTASSLVQLGKQALIPSQAMLNKLEAQWKKGDRTLPFLNKYIRNYAAADKDYEEALESYIKQSSTEEKQQDKFRDFVYKYTTQIQSSGFDAIIADKNAFKKQFGTEKFDKKINTMCLQTVAKAAKTQDKAKLDACKNVLKNLKTKNYKQQMAFLDVKYYGLAKDWKNYDKNISKYLKKYKKNDDVAHRNVAWNYYMYVTDKNLLNKAEKWAQKAISLNKKSHKNYLTQAYLLYKLEKYSAAQVAVESALAVAKDTNKPAKGAEILKKKIQSALAGQKKEVVIEKTIK